eukprot:7336097-Prymnesium_polylepis.1
MVNQWMDETCKWDGVTIDAMVLDNNDAHTIARTVTMWKRRGGILIVGHKQMCVDKDGVLVGEKLDIDQDTIIVVDEAHFIKSPSTELYNIMEVKLECTSKRIFLTGTPLQNNIYEFYHMIHLLEKGRLGETVYEFKKMYGNDIDAGMAKIPSERQIERREQAIEVMRRVSAHIIQERSAALLQEYLPAKRDFKVLHTCTGDIKKDSSVIQERLNVQAASLADKVKCTLTIIHAVLAKEPDAKIVVFSTLTENLSAMNQCYPGFMFDGTLQKDARSRMIHQFQNEDDSVVLYSTTKAGGVGLTLTRANHVVLMDVSWNPVDDRQAIARIYRIGQKKEVTVYRLLCADSIEDTFIYKLATQKQMLASRIMDEKQINREIFSSLDHSRNKETPVSQEAIDECQILSILTKLSAQTSASGGITLVPTSPVNAYTLFAHGTLFLDKAVELSANDEMMSRHVEVNLTIKAKLTAAEGARDTTKTDDELARLKKRAQRKLTTEDGTEQLVDINAVYFNAPYDNELVPAYTPSVQKIQPRNSGVFELELGILGPCSTTELQQCKVEKGGKWVTIPRLKSGPDKSMWWFATGAKDGQIYKI